MYNLLAGSIGCHNLVQLIPFEHKLYMNHTLPFVTAAGGKLLFFGKGGPFLIGPEQEYWDSVLLVQHASTAKFLSFATDEGYLAIAGHRTAALVDSRLLPIEQKG